MLQPRLQIVQPFEQAFMFAAFGAAQLGRDFFGLARQGYDIAYRLSGHAPERFFGGKGRMLLQVADRGRTARGDASCIRGLLTGENAQQGRLAGTVGAYERNVVTAANLEVNRVQNRFVPECLAYTRSSQQHHTATISKRSPEPENARF